MDSSSIRKNKSWNFSDLFYIGILFLLTAINYVDYKSHTFIVVIIRSALSVIIFILISNRNEEKCRYIYFIGVGYIISNIFDIISVVYIGKNIFITNINIIGNMIEIISFLFGVKILLSDENSQNKVLIIPVKIFIIFSVLLIFLLIDISLFKINELEISTSDIVLLFNIGFAIYTMKQYEIYSEKNNDDKDRISNINKILFLKVICFIYILCYKNIMIKSDFVRIIIEGLSIIQIYLIYRIIVYTSIIDPYIKIINANKEIEKQSKLYENTNYVLSRADKIQLETSNKIIYRDDFLHSILESTPNGWGIFDENLKLSYFNNVFKTIVDYRGNILDSIQKNILDSDLFKNSIKEVCLKKNNLENEIKTNNGNTYKCCYVYCDDHKGCICILIDITYEKLILEKLIELNEEYEDLIVNIKSPVFICDDNYEIVKSSRLNDDIFSEKILYINADESDLESIKHDGYKIHPEDIESCNFVSDINKNAKANSEVYNNGFFRYRVINNYGEIRYIESNTTINYEGDKKYTIISCIDISKYINTRQYLEKTQNMYKDILDSIPEGIYLEDIDTKMYMFVNTKFINIFSLDDNINKEGPGVCRQDLMTIHPDYEEVISKSIDQIRNNKISDYAYLKYIDINGKIIEAQVASIPFKVGNKILKLTIIEDMVDIKYLEDLKKKIIDSKKHDKLKMEFFINMSHELKTPLNLMFTSTQLLENLYNKCKISCNSNHLEKHIELTKQNSFRLLKIINDLIDFTKMESGFYKVRMQSKDIILIIEDIVMSVVGYAESKNISLVFDTDIEELVMNVDVNAIERILLNMLSNAVKFTDSGGNIYVNVYYNYDTIDIVIEDTGIGIPKDKIDFIFERFNDVNKGFIGNIYGSGIGLSMVKSICNLIGADINVESEYGKGTKFTIRLKVNNENVLNYEIEEKYENISNIERLTVDMADIYKI